MKEDQSEFKKISLDTMHSTKHTLLTKRITLLDMGNYPGTSRKTTDAFQDVENPQILNEDRYEGVFREILKDTKKMHKYFSDERDTI